MPSDKVLVESCSTRAPAEPHPQAQIRTRYMSTLYEIIELPNGDIALQRADEEGEPLVSIRFSKESMYFLNDAKIDIAKAMIEAGLEAAGEIHDQNDQSDMEIDDEFDLPIDPTIIH